MAAEEANVSKQEKSSAPGLHVLAKPIGPVCDIKCEYCFHLEKHALFDKGENYRTSDDVLRAYIAQHIAAQPTPVVEFVWHGEGTDAARPRLLPEGRRAAAAVPGRQRDQECSHLLEKGLPVTHAMEAVKGPLAIRRD